MKLATVVLTAAALLFLAGLNSCKKETSQNPVKSNTELLTQKTWKFEVRGLDENNNGTIEASESDMLPCQSDDSFTFYAQGNGIYKPGSLQCAPDDVNTNFNWYFSANEAELAIFAYPEKVNKLDENTLEIYHEEDNTQNQTVKYITRFQH